MLPNDFTFSFLFDLSAEGSFCASPAASPVCTRGLRPIAFQMVKALF
jgi:hypothetical protein